MKNILIVPDPHATPEVSNERADWVGEFIKDIRPDCVVVMGDVADMGSLCSYDKGTKGFVGRSYQRDIESAVEFSDRLFHPIKKSKKRQPYKIVLEGNHENRIKKAINRSPELDGAISFKDLDFDKYYHEVVEYDGDTPGLFNLLGITFAHYMVSGVMGRPISGNHLAHSLIAKNHRSVVVGHNHTFDYSVSTSATGQKLHGLCSGVYQEHHPKFAGGQGNNLWWRGIVYLRDVEDGSYDISTIGIERLKKEYGHRA